MFSAKVVGRATATIKHPTLEGWKLLIVQPYGPDGRTPDGDPLIVADALGAGIGEVVLITSDGKGTRELIGEEKTPVRWSTLGICD